MGVETPKMNGTLTLEDRVELLEMRLHTAYEYIQRLEKKVGLTPQEKIDYWLAGVNLGE
jgi:hypothetical protein